MNLPEIEKNNVVDVYSKISKDFSRTRYKVWPNVEEFIKSFPNDTKFLEVGCGNGKNMLLRPNEFKGCDICKEFVELCTERNLDVIEADATELPFSNLSFDVTISVAVIHHLSTVERRMKAINEMLRVTKKGGKLLIEVWSLENNDKADGSDTMISWSLRGKMYERYYHFFEKNEIVKLIKNANDCMIDTILWEKSNWVLHVTKN